MYLELYPDMVTHPSTNLRPTRPDDLAQALEQWSAIITVPIASYCCNCFGNFGEMSAVSGRKRRQSNT